MTKNTVLTQKLKKWGNASAIRIPKSIASAVGLHEDQDVEVSISNGTIILRPIKSTPDSLDALLIGMDSETSNIDSQWLDMRSVGKENIDE